MNDEKDRAGLEGPPPSMTPGQSDTKPSAPATQTSNFDFNQPTIISLLYLSSFILGVTVIVGVVLAYVWKGDSKEAWEASHYQYLINTFWIGLVGVIVGVMLMIVLIGFLIIPAVMVLVVVRCVLSLINAQKKEPMPNPSTLLA